MEENGIKAALRFAEWRRAVGAGWWFLVFLIRAQDSCYHSSHIERHPARERKLILLRYGLAGQPPLTQLETAQLLQISRSYVSRLETHALEQLRKGWLQESPGE
ncbi:MULTISPECIES: sigma factor-like helix-turn-helix DNA-binding protein [Faecalibacterium]|uniref:sigma factor-like helix-turn-helix DNA-binding protein n=1 Tax=Faecalibacterium TaxID=216851 RepID=UPI0012DE436B|nr:hypothetical protein [Faecalibacterium sp. Marseille-Q4137]MBO1309058.1 hypothetical protein [Faecalibacterium sp. Marseille-Q4164]